MPEPFEPSGESSSPSQQLLSEWVAQFAPLVMDEDSWTASELRARLKLADRLTQSSGLFTESELGQSGTDPTLVQTFHHAREQLPSIIEDIRRKLGRAAPGDPEGLPDLESIQDKLDERAARQELGLHPGDLPEVLDLRVNTGNWAAAAGIGTFGFGWTSFTTFHAVLMIGGMSKVFGWGALALLGFYSIFYLVGFAMLAAAFHAAATERVTLDGHELTLEYRLGPIVRHKQVHLLSGSKARLGKKAQKSGSNQGSEQAILMTDTEGREVAFGQYASPEQRRRVCDQVNAYLTGHS